MQAAQKRSLEASTAQSLEASLRADRAANEAHGHSSMLVRCRSPSCVPMRLTTDALARPAMIPMLTLPAVTVAELRQQLAATAAQLERTRTELRQLATEKQTLQFENKRQMDQLAASLAEARAIAQTQTEQVHDLKLRVSSSVRVRGRSVGSAPGTCILMRTCSAAFAARRGRQAL